MTIIDYFEDSRKALWQEQIAAADWRAAKYLLSLLNNGEAFDDYLGSGARLYLLIDGEKIVSFATLSQKDCIADDRLYPWIGFVYTFPAYRGHRYSEKLIHHAENVARDCGCENIYISTDHDNLYEKYGFTYLETRVDRFHDAAKLYYKHL